MKASRTPRPMQPTSPVLVISTPATGSAPFIREWLNCAARTPT
jgi:hypothetical protein